MILNLARETKRDCALSPVRNLLSSASLAIILILLQVSAGTLSLMETADSKEQQLEVQTTAASTMANVYPSALVLPWDAMGLQLVKRPGFDP